MKESPADDRENPLGPGRYVRHSPRNHRRPAQAQAETQQEEKNVAHPRRKVSLISRRPIRHGW